MPTRRLLLFSITIVLLGSLVWVFVRMQNKANCDLLRQSQNMQLLSTTTSDKAEIREAISEIYRIEPSIVRPTHFVGNPFISYVWNDGAMQYVADTYQDKFVTVNSGWNDLFYIRISDLYSCLGEPLYYSVSQYSMTPGETTASLIYVDPDIRVVIAFDESKNLNDPKLLVEIFNIRNVNASDIKELIKYAYSISEEEEILAIQSGFQLWDSASE